MIVVIAYGTIVALFLCWWLLGLLQRVSRPRPAKETRSSSTDGPSCGGSERQHSQGNESKPLRARASVLPFVKERRRRPYLP